MLLLSYHLNQFEAVNFGIVSNCWLGLMMVSLPLHGFQSIPILNALLLFIDNFNSLFIFFYSLSQ